MSKAKSKVALRNFRALILAIFAWHVLFAATAHAADKPLKLCLLSGCQTYHSEKSLPPFQEWLEKNYPVKCTRLTREGDKFPDLAPLAECDVTFVFFKRTNLAGEQLEAFQKHVRSGKPVVAVRTASHAVQTWLAFDKKILGGNYQGHYEAEPKTMIDVTDAGQQHPIFKGVTLTTAPGPLYKNAGHAEDITILLTGSNPGRVEPLAWSREVNGGRVFYTSLGNVETFADDEFRTLLANAIFWAAGRKANSE